MDRFYKKDRTAVNWFISYVLVFTISIAILLFWSIKINRMIESEVWVSNNAVFDHLSDNLKKTTTNINLLSMDLSSNPDILKIASYSGEVTNTERYELIAALGRIKNYKLFNDKIKGFYIYFPKIDTLLTNSSVTDTDTYFYGNFGINYNQIEAWQSTLDDNYSKSRYFLFGDDKELIYAHSLFVNSGTTRPDANIFISVDKQILDLDIENADFLRGGAALIMDDTSNILYYTGNEKYKDHLSELPFSVDDSKNIRNIGNMRVTVIGKHITPINWDYISIVPYSSFWSSLRYARQYSTMLFMLSVILGIILIFVITKRNYKPLKELVNGLIPYSDTDVENVANEYELINNIVDRVLEESSSFKGIVYDQNRIIRQNLLENLLCMDDMEVLSVDPKKYGIVFESDHFVVVAIYLNNNNNRTKKMDPTSYQKTNELLDQVACDLFEKAVEQLGSAYSTIIKNTPIILINISESLIGTWRDSISSIDIYIHEMVNKYLDASATITVSSLHHSMLEISQAYHEATSPIFFNKWNGEEGVMFYDDMNADIPFNDSLTLAHMYKLRSSLNSGDIDSAMALVDFIFKNAASDTEGASSAKNLMGNLSAAIIMIINEFAANVDAKLISELLYLSNTSDNVVAFRSKLKSVISCICNETTTNKPLYIKEKICTYIDDNYHDIDLSLNKVAEYMHMNPTYISREFKKQAGATLNDYILNTRINHAKVLLAEGKLTVSQVSTAVGYDNPRTFTRNFLKIEGVTPSAYKKMR